MELLCISEHADMYVIGMPAGRVVAAVGVVVGVPSVLRCPDHAEPDDVHDAEAVCVGHGPCRHRVASGLLRSGGFTAGGHHPVAGASSRVFAVVVDAVAAGLAEAGGAGLLEEMEQARGHAAAAGR